MSYKAIRKSVCEANRELEQYGLLFLDEGGASAIDRERGVVVVRPAGKLHATLTPEDMLVVDLAGTLLEGESIPAPDLVAHLFLYQAFPEISGIANTYSPHATLFAQAGRPIPCLGVVHARCFKGEIPVTRALRKPEIERNYEKSLGGVIVERFARLNPLEIPGVLVAHHGPFTWGRTVGDAVLKSAALERAAQLAFGTLVLTPQAQPVPTALSDKHFSRD
ncbi:MAG: class II aldolase/adducin family protein [bacterium]